ncbi:MAG: HAD-IC family P-type ATPase [Lachnospiraceae bacterium]|nr:HAD-IC family P-type ATPase [Lachnospiraceae bacterium]
MTKKQKNMLKRIIISFVLLAALMICEHMGVFGSWTDTWLLLPFYAIPYLIIGYDIIYKAARNIRNGQIFDENFLMMLATFGAFGVREYSEAAAVMLFYQVGELFQSYAVGKSRQSIADMMDICPEYANIKQDGALVQVDPDDVEVGSVIVVKPGERIPLDGVVIEGESFIDTAALTGESVPRKTSAGEEIFSGCVNGNGTLKIKTTKEFDDSTVAKILELVENASSKKAKTEKFITKFARYYTPVVTIAAVLLAFVPPLILGGGLGMWIQRACTFLVISCPCALVISVPLGFFGGIGAASRMGVLVKGGNFLEAVAEMTTIVFDKTGTLTKGEFKVTKILLAERRNGEEANDGQETGDGEASSGDRVKKVCENSSGENSEKKRKLLELAALGEGYSNHPIAVSIREAYEKDGGKLEMSRVEEAKETAGHGICVRVDGREVLLGNEKLMRLEDIDYEPVDEAGTIVYAACEEQYLGAVVISDVVKEGAAEAIRSMKKVGVKKCVMLTGDRKQAADKVAGELGIDEVHAELLPADKVSIVETLLANQRGKEKLAFAGDGINDAPVLSRADIGIAMGSMGSDAAIEAADVVLMDDDVKKIAAVVKCARKTLRIVKQNIVFALGIKALVLILGALGMANMWEAVFADVGVAVIAIMNSMRALRAD